jgi:hypothetical protein
MKMEGEGQQDVGLFKCKVEAVLQDLLADKRLEGCQHFVFKEYKNAKGDSILGWHARRLEL